MPRSTFHDGSEWNVAAWQKYAEFSGVADFGTTAYSIVGPYTIEEISTLEGRAKCGGPFPLFEWGLYLSHTYSPQALQAEDFVGELLTTGVVGEESRRLDNKT